MARAGAALRIQSLLRRPGLLPLPLPRPRLLGVEVVRQEGVPYQRYIDVDGAGTLCAAMTLDGSRLPIAGPLSRSFVPIRTLPRFWSFATPQHADARTAATRSSTSSKATRVVMAAGPADGGTDKDRLVGEVHSQLVVVSCLLFVPHRQCDQCPSVTLLLSLRLVPLAFFVASHLVFHLGLWKARLFDSWTSAKPGEEGRGATNFRAERHHGSRQTGVQTDRQESASCGVAYFRCPSSRRRSRHRVRHPRRVDHRPG